MALGTVAAAVRTVGFFLLLPALLLPLGLLLGGGILILSPAALLMGAVPAGPARLLLAGLLGLAALLTLFA